MSGGDENWAQAPSSLNTPWDIWPDTGFDQELDYDGYPVSISGSVTLSSWATMQYRGFHFAVLVRHDLTDNTLCSIADRR
jgi:hypothetical protein